MERGGEGSHHLGGYRLKDACEDRKIGLATARRRCRNRSDWRGVTDEIL